MITYILILPLIFLIWAADSVLFVLFVRAAVGRVAPRTQLAKSLEELVDPYLHFAAHTISNRISRRLRVWELYLLAVAALIMTRYFALAIIFVTT